MAKTTKEKIEIMQAYERGEQIQINNSNNMWEDIDCPLFDWANCNYRVKPKKLDDAIESNFKDGDILFVKSLNSWIFIYKENEDKKNIYKYVAVPVYTIDSIIYINDALLCDKEDISEDSYEEIYDYAIKNNVIGYIYDW